MAKEDSEHSDSSFILELQLRCIAYLWLLLNPQVAAITLRLNQKKGEIDMTTTRKAKK
jgi:hypothetical protein